MDVPLDRLVRLARLGIVIGQHWVFLRGLVKPSALPLRSALWRAEHGAWGALPIPPGGRVSIATVPDIDPAYYAAIGYPAIGPRAVRIDMLERLMARLHRATTRGAMPPDPTIAPVLGCTIAEADAVLAALGWGRQEIDGAVSYRRQRPAGENIRRRRVRPAAPRKENDQSPFALLQNLTLPK